MPQFEISPHSEVMAEVEKIPRKFKFVGLDFGFEKCDSAEPKAIRYLQKRGFNALHVKNGTAAHVTHDWTTSEKLNAFTE